MTEKMKRAKFKDIIRGRVWPILLLFLAIAIWTGESYLTNDDFKCTFEKPMCRWYWDGRTGFQHVTGQQAQDYHDKTGLYVGPFTDSENKSTGHYLNLLVLPGEGEAHIWSALMSHTMRDCKISLWLNMANMTDGRFFIAAHGAAVSWVISDMFGNNNTKWERYESIVGEVIQPIKIFLVAVPSKTLLAGIALDHIELIDCFPVVPQRDYGCRTEYFQCSPTKFDYCLNRSQLCDIKVDCLNGIDEQLGCEAVPEIGRCNFSDTWCGWHNAPNTQVNWTALHTRPNVRRITGPIYDRTFRNETGTFLYANMSLPGLKFGGMALLDSTTINPPPLYHSNPKSEFYKSCEVRFFYHQFGRDSGSFSLQLIEHLPEGNRSLLLFRVFGNRGDKWMRAAVTLPRYLRNPFHLQFMVQRSLRPAGVGLDDITLSRECFGLAVPENAKEGYDYNTFKGFPEPTLPTETHRGFVNKTVYTFTTCGATGRIGPTQELCWKEYQDTNVVINMVDDSPMSGIQEWIVPETNFYTIIAKGAGGGSGPDGMGSSRGATTIGIIKLEKRKEIYMLVGQEGLGGCRRNFAMTQHYSCGRIVPPKPTPPGPIYSPPRPKPPPDAGRLVLDYSGGGGGGGTFVYEMAPDGRRPLMISGGGAGLGGPSSKGDLSQNGRGLDPTRSGISGMEYGPNSPGAGGGWRSGNRTTEMTGGSLLSGGLGGQACGIPKGYHGTGGFGGGGGGCASGGGGGGFTGGSASAYWTHGRGGYSYLSLRMQDRRVFEGTNSGPGSVIIIPAVKGCGCSYLCAAADENRESVRCICPSGQILDDNMANCEDDFSTTIPAPTEPPDRELHIKETYVYVFLGMLVLSLFCFVLQIGYKCFKTAQRRHRVRRGVAGQQPTENIELQTLPQATENIMTEDNPTYEDAVTNLIMNLPGYKDLKLIPLECLRFDRALGQGAFGEVFQGYYKTDGEGPEMPVAIKTLPAFTSTEAESDFIMEAVIMSKFDHPNIVRFIGICFDRSPRYIVLELLSGGDLKNFLRENRTQEGSVFQLTMRELLMMARDIAKGCVYLEERRFIHRDIAARNCLLTSRGEDKTVKLGDFGMAKDIYRSDYYRKSGKALIPVRWMPPEAFRDGLFTTKTDVWSYGILLWEIFSIGLTPYPGYDNIQVMDFVMRGGRLSPPGNCPREIYAIMRHCWRANQDERPTFTYLLERMESLLKNPRILNTSIRLYARPRHGRRSRLEDQVRDRDGEGEAAARPDTDGSLEDRGDDTDVADEEHRSDDAAGATAGAVDDTQVICTEADFDNPQPGTSKGALGKISKSDSLRTIFVVASEVSAFEDPRPGITGWLRTGKDKTIDYSRRRSLSEIMTIPPPPPHELPVISDTRGPLGPKGRLKASEIKRYSMNFATVGRIDREESDSSDDDST